MEILRLRRFASSRKSLSLRATLVRAISLVLAVTLVISGVLTYWQAASKVETEVGSAIAIAEKTVRKAIQEIAHDADPRLELVRLVHVFDGNRHVKAAYIEPGHTGPGISSLVAPVDELPEWFYELIAQPQQVVRIELPERLTSYGAFELSTEQRGEVGEVWDELLLKFTILTVFCGLLAALVYLVLGRALEPLPVISAAFARLGGGDYGVRVPEKGPTELAQLCVGFNEMAARLGQMEVRNRQLADQLATVQDEERSDLARDLHDEVSPFLFSVDVDASTIRRMASAPEQAQLASRADAIREAVAHMKKHVKSILGRLRPVVHLELGLANAIDSLVTSWQLRNPEVTFKVDVTDRVLGQKLDTVIHGIVREALSNALKHGKPTTIDVAVALSEGDVIEVKVRDDGGGLRPASTGSGFGLIAMRERVGALDGTVDIRNRDDRAGVEVKVRLPALAADAALDEPTGSQETS
jgi:two-component system sensor histidine kinase UhpB